MRPHQDKKLLHGKENSSKMKREPTIQENIFANHTSDKGLISKIYKEHRSPLQENKQSNYKMVKVPEQTLLQGGLTEGPETYEKMLNIKSYQRDAN